MPEEILTAQQIVDRQNAGRIESTARALFPKSFDSHREKAAAAASELERKEVEFRALCAQWSSLLTGWETLRAELSHGRDRAAQIDIATLQQNVRLSWGADGLEPRHHVTNMVSNYSTLSAARAALEDFTAWESGKIAELATAADALKAFAKAHAVPLDRLPTLLSRN